MKKRFIAFFFVVFFPQTFFAATWGCVASSVSELFLPGLGYVIQEQYGKLIYSAANYYAIDKVIQARKDPSFDHDFDNIFNETTSTDSNGEEIVTIDLNYNKATWENNVYSGISSNLTLMAFWDLYSHDCKNSDEIHSVSYAPLNFKHFYNKWQFWLPLVVVYLSASNKKKDESPIINWHLSDDLNQDQIRNESFALFYTVGIGEELIFRDLIQKKLYYFYNDTFSKSTSHHLGVVTAATLFGLAHGGQGFSANPSQAFLGGLYFGYLYQPEADQFDLTSAIALHSWYDILVTYYTIQNGNFTPEQRSAATYRLLNIDLQY